MKTIKILTMAALALMTAACSNDDNDLTPQQPQKAEGIPFSATISIDNGATTRALAESGTTISATWADGEQVALIYTVESTAYKTDATVTAQGDGTATISATLQAGATNNSDVTIIYPASAADGTTGNVKADLLAAQDGTLTGTSGTSIAEKYDVRKGTGKLSISGGTATVNNGTPGTPVTLTNQNAIFKFTLSGPSIDATHPLVIKDGSENVITTVTPASTATSVYVAMPAAASSTYKFIVTTADNKYIKSGTAAITAGNYYQTTLAMTARYPLAMANATVDDLGSVIASDGNIYLTNTAIPGGNTASGIIAYVGSAGSVDTSTSVDANCSTYKGLAIALTDANSGSGCQWYTDEVGGCADSGSSSVPLDYKNGIANTNTLTNDGHTHAAASAASSYGTSRPSSGVSAWFLPSIGQWNLIVQGLATKKSGSTVSTNLTTQNNGTYTAGNLNSVITDAGGTGFQSNRYWSSTGNGYYTKNAWNMALNNGFAGSTSKKNDYYVRAVFAF